MMNRFVVLGVALMSVTAQAADPTLDLMNRGILAGRKTCDLQVNPGSINTTEIFRSGLQLGQSLKDMPNPRAALANLEKGIVIGEQSCAAPHIPVAIAMYDCNMTVADLSGRSMNLTYSGRLSDTLEECVRTARVECEVRNQNRDPLTRTIKALCKNQKNIVEPIPAYYVNFGNGDVRPLP